MRFVTSKNRALQKCLETTSRYSILVQFMTAQEGGLQFYQTRSNAVVLCDTLPTEFIEKAVCIKTGEQLYQKESERHLVRSKQIRNVNHMIYQVKKQDRGLPNPRHISLNGQTVAKLIEKFESHKYKEQFLKDMSQT